jgi:arylsulfatase A-like enzyme
MPGGAKRVRKAGVLAGVVVAGVLLLAVAHRHLSTPPSSPLPNVVLVLIDTLRADHVGGYGYFRDTTPSVDRLIVEGAAFDAAFSTSSWSVPAHVSLLTGMLPERHGVFEFGEDLPSQIRSLPTFLQERGYSTGIFAAHLPMYSSVEGLSDGFDHRMIVSGLEEEKLVPAAIEWVHGQSPPFFLYLVLLTPHAPYERYPPAYDEELFTDMPSGGERKLEFSESRWASETGIPRRARLGDHDEVGYYINRYDRSARYADAMLGELLEGLEAEGLLANALLVVTSDHGEALGDHGAMTHEILLYDSLVRVPLVLYSPGRIPGGQRWKEQVDLTEVVPTILGLVGAQVPPTDLDGRDLSAHLQKDTRPEEERLISAAYVRRHYRRFMLRTPCFKLIRSIDLGREEFYDLCADPGESNDLADAPLPRAAAEQRASLRLDMDRLVARYRDRRVPLKRTLERRTLDELRALGYVGGGTMEPSPPR